MKATISHEKQKQRMKKKYFLPVFIVLFFGMLPFAMNAQPKIEHDLERIIKEAKVPGMQVMHIKEGVSKLYSVGVKEIHSGNPVTPNTLFQACSMSKTVFAYAALILSDKSVFNLDTPLSNYWEYPRLNEEPEGKKITARMVLNHTAGFPNWTKPKGSKLKVSFEPGKGFSYSGEAFLYLQFVLEHLTGQKIEEIIANEVFKPLGMSSSSYLYSDKMEDNFANGHDELKPLALRKYMRENVAYSLITNASDYTNFIQKALINGEGLKPETHKMMLEASSQRNKNIRSGLGVMMQSNEKGKAVFHNGSNPGFRCFFFTYPDTGESLVCFTNGTNGSKIKKEIATLFLGKQTFNSF